MKIFKISFLLFLVVATTRCGLFKNKVVTSADRIQHFQQIKLSTDFPVEVLWTENLIPRIKAENSKDLFYTLGAVQVHLRRTQLEIYRKLSRGALSEMAGPFTIKIDKFLKAIDFESAAQTSLKEMSPESVQVLEWMASGMNDYIKQSKHRPKDLNILGLSDENWTVLDLVRVYKFTSIDVNWTIFSQLLEFNNSDFANQLWSLKVNEKDFFEEFFTEYQRNKDSVEANPNGIKTSSLLKGFDSNKSSFDLSAFDHINDVTKAGSNAFAVQGLKTKSKAAIVSNDPHLGLMIPNIWLFVILDSPEYKSMGYIIPSFPVPAIGRNMDIAWGGTNLYGISTFPSVLSSEDAEKVTEEKKKLRVRFWPDRNIKTYKLGSYAVLKAKDFPQIGTKDIVFRWQGYQASNEVETFLKMNKAKNFNEFHNAFNSYGAPGMTFVYGDKKGNVGKVIALNQPQVKTMKFLYEPDDFTDQFLNSMNLPVEFNPKSEFVVSANDYTKGLRQAMSLFQAPNERRDRMTFLLKNKSEVTLEDVKQLHEDVFSYSAFQLKNALVHYIQKNKLIVKNHKELLDALESWNGNYDVDSKGALVFEVLLASWSDDVIKNLVLKDITSMDLKQKAFSFLIRHFNYRSFLALTLKETEFLDKSKLEKYFDKVQMALNKNDTWGDFHTLELRHPLGNLKLFRYNYTFYKGPWAGGNETLMKASHKLSTKSGKTTFGAQARWMTDLSSVNENYLVYLGGQDGYIGSENIDDLTMKWKDGNYLKVPFEREEFKNISAIKGQ